MKPKHLILFCALTLLEGFITLYYLFNMTFEAGRGQVIDYGTLRNLAAGVIVLLLVGLAAALFRLVRGPEFSASLSARLENRLVGEGGRLFTVQGGLLIAALFLFECYLLTYLAFPVPLRPLFAWGTIICLQAWLILRAVYRGAYRARPGWIARLKTGWNSWLPVQRKVLIILAILGFVYFLVFLAPNYLRDPQTHFNMNPDEDIIYPDVVIALQTGATFEQTVWNALGNWQWWYGFPYLPMSAAVLVIPRLVFGNEFGLQVQLNMFLLRTFISVLPMTLLILFAVYLVTRYKHLWASVGLFFFFAFLPGVFWYNLRFWHPDAIVVILILLTIYFLEKDDLRFERYFYYAAVTVGLTTAIKLWGLFFGVTIAGYLVAGLVMHRVTLKKAILAGFFFILAMLGTFILTSPTMMVPYLAKGAAASWFGQQDAILGGYNEPGFEWVYQTGLSSWLYFFGIDFMKPFFFFFSFLALGFGSLLGSRKAFNRLNLGWCLATAFFLINFSAMKSPQYQLPLMIPIICSAALFPMVADGTQSWKIFGFLQKPLAKRVLIVVTVVLFAVQFWINLTILYGRIAPNWPAIIWY